MVSTMVSIEESTMVTVSNAEHDTLTSLMERYVDGDLAAFDALFERLRGPLTATLRRRLRTEDKIDDAIQNTWLKVHRSRHRYRVGRPVVPWVLTIARNVAIDHLRSRAAQEQGLSPEEAHNIPDRDVSADRGLPHDEQKTISAVREAVSKLPPKSRDVVRMHKLEGRSMAEIARTLGISEGAVRVRGHRGYKALGKLLSAFRPDRATEH